MSFDFKKYLAEGGVEGHLNEAINKPLKDFFQGGFKSKLDQLGMDVGFVNSVQDKGVFDNINKNPNAVALAYRQSDSGGVKTEEVDMQFHDKNTKVEKLIGKYQFSSYDGKAAGKMDKSGWGALASDIKGYNPGDIIKFEPRLVQGDGRAQKIVTFKREVPQK